MPGEHEPTRNVPVALVTIGLLVGLVIGAVAAWRLSDDPVTEEAWDLTGVEPVPSVPESPEAAEAFLVAWERSRGETYLAVSEWNRRTAEGAEVTEVRVLAQRPPDRIRSGTDHRSGRIGDAVYACDRLPIADEGGDGGESLEPEVECRTTELPSGSDHAAEFEAALANEVSLMRRHVEGTRPLYRVGQVDDCFYLRLDRSMVVPPYGYSTTFCFDAESGAVSSLVVRRAEATDTEDLLWVSREVTDADLVAVIEGTFEPSGR